MPAKVIAALLVLVAAPVAAAAVIWPTSALGAVDPAPSPTAVAEIPPELLDVYRAAAATCPGLPWPVLAAIGWVESRHGRGTTDLATGDVRPPIVGPPLDGTGGVALIRDPAAPDGYGRAQGPMQFLTTTWRTWATLAPDRPATTEPDPHNAWDAIFTAARYLCGGRPRLTDVPAAIRRYNRSDTYVDAVLAKAREYQLAPAPRPAGAAVGAAPERAVAAAMTQLGVPYLWGGTTPGAGFDCSGLVQWAYAQAGVTLPRTTFQQVEIGVPVDPDHLRVGDLVFSASVQGGRTIPLGHVAIYVGGHQIIVAPRTGDVVSLRPLPTRVQAIRRVVIPGSRAEAQR